MKKIFFSIIIITLLYNIPYSFNSYYKNTIYGRYGRVTTGNTLASPERIIFNIFQTPLQDCTDYVHIVNTYQTICVFTFNYKDNVYQSTYTYKGDTNGNIYEIWFELIHLSYINPEQGYNEEFYLKHFFDYNLYKNNLSTTVLHKDESGILIKGTKS